MLRALRLNPHSPAQWADSLKTKIIQSMDKGDHSKAVRSLLSFKAEMVRNDYLGDTAVASAYNQAENHVLENLD